MSSPYDVSVGGLDFADTYLGENNTYWNATNNVFYGSAKSYIMEQPWNDDCAGTLLAHYETGSLRHLRFHRLLQHYCGSQLPQGRRRQWRT